MFPYEVARGPHRDTQIQVSSHPQPLQEAGEPCLLFVGHPVQFRDQIKDYECLLRTTRVIQRREKWQGLNSRAGL